MVDWQVTATTIYCDTVDYEVTLLVYKDGSAKCTGRKKSAGVIEKIVDMVARRIRQSERSVGCEGLECYRVIQYRDKLFAEEAGEGRSEPIT